VHPVREVGLDRLVHEAGRDDRAGGGVELYASILLVEKRSSGSRLGETGLAASSFGAGAVAVAGVGSPEAGPDLQSADLSDLTGWSGLRAMRSFFLVERQLDGGKRVAVVSGRCRSVHAGPAGTGRAGWPPLPGKWREVGGRLLAAHRCLDALRDLPVRVLGVLVDPR
jgi:hypothetical protein